MSSLQNSRVEASSARMGLGANAGQQEATGDFVERRVGRNRRRVSHGREADRHPVVHDDALRAEVLGVVRDGGDIGVAGREPRAPEPIGVGNRAAVAQLCPDLGGGRGVGVVGVIEVDGPVAGVGRLVGFGGGHGAPRFELRLTPLTSVETADATGASGGDDCMAGSVHLEVDGAVATITNDNPAKHNAFDDEMDAQLFAILSEVKARPDIRAVVWRGEGLRGRRVATSRPSAPTSPGSLTTSS